MEPSEEDRRQAHLLQLALSDPPPDETVLAQANLSPEELGVVQSLLQLRSQNPDAPQLAAMRARLGGMESATLEVTDTELRFALGGQTMVRSYTVVSENDDQVVVTVLHPSGEVEEDTFQFRSADALALIEPSGKTTMLHRQPGGG